jgi:mannosyltransferase OCH1-like enzyme
MNISDWTFPQLDQYLLAQMDCWIIHQVWFGTIPTRLQARMAYQQPILKSCRNSWDLLNPQWCHVIWTRAHVVQLIQSHYAEYESMFFGFPYEIQRCDFIRYCILHRYGGVYADMDYKCCKPLEEMYRRWTKHDIYLVESPNSPGNAAFVSNSLMIARVRDHPFWKILLVQIHDALQQRYVLFSRHFEIMYTTGPGILTHVFNIYRFRYRLQGLPSDLFHPLSLHKKTLSKEERERAYAIHYGFGSWEGLDSKILIEIWTHYGIFLWCLLVFCLPQLWVR